METKKHLINPFLNKSTWHPNRMTSLIKNWHHFTLQSHYHEISNNLWRSRLFSCFAHIDNNVFACFFLVINMLIEQIQFNRVFQGQIEILNNFTKILIERNTLLNSIQKANISVRLRNSKKIKVKNLRSVRAKKHFFRSSGRSQNRSFYLRPLEILITTNSTLQIPNSFDMVDCLMV